MGATAKPPVEISPAVKQSIEAIKNPSARKIVEQGAAIAAAHGDEVPSIVVTLFKSRNIAMYSASNDKIFISSKTNSKSQAEFDKQVALGWWSQSNPVLHEMGHKIHSDAVGNAFDNTKNHQFSDAQKQAIKTKVSGYAATNALEFVAEVYAGDRSGKVYDEEIKRLLDIVTQGRVKL